MAEAGLNDDLEKTINCPICFEYMLDSRTLYPCVHTFCAKCVAHLERSRRHGQTGVECPLCRGFIQEKEIRKNRLMNALINLVTEENHSESDLDGVLINSSCIQCDSPKVTSKCLSCNIDLCQKCKDGHRRIPGFKEHKVVCNTDFKRQKSMTDVVIYCTNHRHEQINANCKECDIAICDECRHGDHKAHQVESLSTALKRYRLMLKSALANISRKSKQKQKKIAQIKEYRKKIVENESTILSALESHKEKLLVSLKKLESKINYDYDQISIDLKTNTGSEIKKLDIMCDELEHAIICDDSVKVWAEAIAANTDGGGLLNELQAGLLNKIQEIQNQLPTSSTKCPIYKFVPSLKALEDLEKMKLGEILKGQDNISKTLSGEPVESCQDIVAASIANITHFASIRSLSHTEISTIYQSWLEKERDVNIPTQFSRMCLFQNQIWIPCPTYGNIKVFSPKDGSSVKTYSLRVTYPYSLQVLNNDSLILASCSGLHVLNSKGAIIKMVHEEQFSDVFVGEEMIIGLQKKSIIIWNTSLFQLKTFPINIGMGVNTVCLHQSYIYICESLCHIIHKFTLQGQLIQQFGTIDDVPKGELRNIHICGCDDQGNLIIANYKDLKVLSCLGEWSTISIPVHKASDVLVVGSLLFVLQEQEEERFGKTISIYRIVESFDSQGTSL